MSTPSIMGLGLASSAYIPGQQDQLFGRIDANSDGQISPDEMNAFRQNLPGDSAKKQNLFNRIDTNGDGFVSNQEWAAHRAQKNNARSALLQMQEQSGAAQTKRHHGPSGARSSNPDANFNALDTNKDGTVSSEEWAAAFGNTGGATISSDVQSSGVQSATGVLGTVNSAMNNVTNTVKNTATSLSQALSTLI